MSISFGVRKNRTRDGGTKKTKRTSERRRRRRRGVVRSSDAKVSGRSLVFFVFFPFLLVGGESAGGPSGFADPGESATLSNIFFCFFFIIIFTPLASSLAYKLLRFIFKHIFFFTRLAFRFAYGKMYNGQENNIIIYRYLIYFCRMDGRVIDIIIIVIITYDIIALHTDIMRVCAGR